MRTHELAHILEGLARLLLAQSDKEVGDIGSSVVRAKRARNTKQYHRQHRIEQLIQVLSLTKPQLREIVDTFNLPVEITDRNSARDVLGRLTAVLRDRPELLQRMRNTAVHGRKDANPQLQAALELLLGTEQ